ncbi:uncharacterized protein LOC115888246 [Sitophilus oryzae]|uniref:Uncharacterized protein LOC115888246 n=1 Tax=Sitophilus oryzae TaxID=7048 RepID=A0A6J2YKV3_SITOR|nr:uncharacterized protein LOC115888246 [Sitophilus oryzae]
MFKIVRIFPKRQILNPFGYSKHHSLRTFLSPAYYCNEVWEHRLQNPILQKVVAEDLYHDLDHRYQRTKQISAIDVDIFVNSIPSDVYVDEMLDLVHKLRLTADSSNTLDSTSHAIVRNLLKFDRVQDLIIALDDRLNYGLFIDNYTGNLLMDTFWKSKQYANGALIASLFMLQEEFEHPLVCAFSLLHCYNYLLNPEGWIEPTVPEEPEEEVKVRVKYLRNPYDDEHFDLKDPQKIVGKTLAMISKKENDPLHQSFYILGMALFGKKDLVNSKCSDVKTPLYKEILDLVPNDNELKSTVNELQTESVNVPKLLIENVNKAYQQTSESDISEQCKVFKAWEEERAKAIEEQTVRLTTAKRLKNIQDLKKAMERKEEKLWFFDNEEKIDLAIDKKTIFYPKRYFGPKKKPKKIDESYVPPDVHTKPTGGSQLS